MRRAGKRQTSYAVESVRIRAPAQVREELDRFAMLRPSNSRRLRYEEGTSRYLPELSVTVDLDRTEVIEFELEEFPAAPDALEEAFSLWWATKPPEDHWLLSFSGRCSQHLSHPAASGQVGTSGNLVQVFDERRRSRMSFESGVVTWDSGHDVIVTFREGELIGVDESLSRWPRPPLPVHDIDRLRPERVKSIDQEGDHLVIELDAPDSPHWPWPIRLQLADPEVTAEVAPSG